MPLPQQSEDPETLNLNKKGIHKKYDKRGNLVV